MTKEQENTLHMYVNDMLAVEKDIFNAVSGQTTDEQVKSQKDVLALIKEISAGSEHRVKMLEKIASRQGGNVGAMVKEAVATAAGTLAGLYGKVRTHPVSRMLRDNHVALNLAAVAYGMLYTTAVAFDDDEIAELTLEYLNELPPQIMGLTSLIPGVVVGELSAEGPVHPEAGDLAREAIEAAWTDAAEYEEI